jgi:hypothetical protein
VNPRHLLILGITGLGLSVGLPLLVLHIINDARRAPTPPEMMTPAEVAAHHDLNDRRTSCFQCCASNGLPYAYGHKQHEPIEGPGCWCRSGSGYSLVPVTTCQAVLQ